MELGFRCAVCLLAAPRTESNLTIGSGNVLVRPKSCGIGTFVAGYAKHLLAVLSAMAALDGSMALELSAGKNHN